MNFVAVQNLLPFECLRCGRQYCVKSTLKRHKKYECGVEKQFQCKVCLRKFKRKDTLRFHIEHLGHVGKK